MRKLFFIVLCAGLGACLSPGNVAKTTPTYSKPMVAVRSDTQVTVILDPQTVHDEMVLSGVSTSSVKSVNLIVSRDLPAALQTYFSRVRVSIPSWAATATGHQIIVNVSIDAMSYEPTNGGVAVVGAMDWSVGMRFADQPDFFYRFTDHTVGRHQITQTTDTNAMVQGVIEEGMQRLLKDLDAKGIQRLVAPAPPPSAAPLPAAPPVAPAAPVVPAAPSVAPPAAPSAAPGAPSAAPAARAPKAAL